MKELDLTSNRLPPDLKRYLEGFTPLQKRYAEYRAKGLSQADAARKAGSEGKDTGSLGRVGYNIEQVEGIKEYILWLEMKRAKAASIDDAEIIDKLRMVFDYALENGKFSDANKAAELLGNMISAFSGKNKEALKPKPDEDQQVQGSIFEKLKNDTNAFKEEDEEDGIAAKVKKIRELIKDTQSKK